jgi:acyl carrier protein
VGPESGVAWSGPKIPVAAHGETASRGEDEATVMSDKIRQIIQEHGRLPVDVQTLGDQADLYQAGLTSHASVNLMLALETAFDVEFPDSMLKRSVFQSVSSIREALQQLGKSAE